MLYDAPTHHGVQFMTGLTVKVDLLYMTYGKDDYRSMLAVWPVSAIKEYVIDVEKMDPEADQFCTVGQDTPRTHLVADLTQA